MTRDAHLIGLSHSLSEVWFKEMRFQRPGFEPRLTIFTHAMPFASSTTHGDPTSDSRMPEWVALLKNRMCPG